MTWLPGQIWCAESSTRYQTLAQLSYRHAQPCCNTHAAAAQALIRSPLGTAPLHLGPVGNTVL
jgi:hypothetical protein